TFTKIGSKWGEVMDLEESKDDLFARNRNCIKTKQEDNILEKFKIIVKGKIFVIGGKELFAWSPVFNKVKEVQPNPESDDDGVSDTYFGESEENLGNEHNSKQPMNDKEKSQDTFNFYDLLRLRKGGVDTLGSNISIPYPPGFTPEKLNNNVDVHEVKDMNTEPSECRSEGLCSRILEEVQHTDDLFSSGVPSNGHMPKKGGSVLEVLDEMIKVGQTIGYTIEDRHLSDHRPILLRDVIADYGVTPFRLYHSWFTLSGFEQLVIHTWNSTVLEDSNGMVRFKKKLQALKKAIREGCNSSFIALIPKVQEPKFVNDDRRISLIGSLYKVVTKILALRLPSVIAGLILDVQTAFLPSRQILDGCTGS
nr:RNA-directed DNA polymerase, eukaryota [Tanacetum cinerariifolium]